MQIEKQCTTCGEKKPVEEFDKQKRGKYGIKSMCKKCTKSASAKQYQRNSEHRLMVAAKWRKANPERIKELSAENYKNNRERIIKNVTKWQNDNPERRRINKAKSQRNNPENMYARSARWRKKHPETCRIICRNRQARKVNAPGNGWTMAEEAQLKKDYGYRCAYCATKTEKPEMDHVIPLAGGGSHNIDNIVPACKSCNSSKRDRPLLVWMYQLRSRT